MNFHKTISALKTIVKRLREAQQLEALQLYSASTNLLNELERTIPKGNTNSVSKFKTLKENFKFNAECLAGLDLDENLEDDSHLKNLMSCLEDISLLLDKGLFPTTNNSILSKIKRNS